MVREEFRAPMLPVLFVLYYRKQDYTKAAEYIRKLSLVNRKTGKFLRCMASDEGTDYFSNQ